MPLQEMHLWVKGEGLQMDRHMRVFHEHELNIFKGLSSSFDAVSNAYVHVCTYVITDQALYCPLI
jgi:hypothetical protein